MFGHHEGPGTQDLHGGIESASFQFHHRQDGKGGERQDLEEHRIRHGKIKANGMVVFRLDRLEFTELLAPDTARLGIGQTLEIGDHVVRGDGTAVGEGGVGVQVKAVGGRRDFFPGKGKSGGESEIVVGVQKLVVDEVKEAPGRAVSGHMGIVGDDLGRFPPGDGAAGTGLSGARESEAAGDKGCRNQVHKTPESHDDDTSTVADLKGDTPRQVRQRVQHRRSGSRKSGMGVFPGHSQGKAAS